MTLVLIGIAEGVAPPAGDDPVWSAEGRTVMASILVAAGASGKIASTIRQRVLRLALLRMLIVFAWLKTDFPWDGHGGLTFVLLLVALAVFLAMRIVRWPEFLSLRVPGLVPGRTKMAKVLTNAALQHNLWIMSHACHSTT